MKRVYTEIEYNEETSVISIPKVKVIGSIEVPLEVREEMGVVTGLESKTPNKTSDPNTLDP